MAPEAALGAVRAEAYRIPTDAPEADGTFAWTSTTIVVVEAEAGGMTGLGYTYSHAAAAGLAAGTLAEAVRGRDATDTPACWAAMQRAVRNMGRSGIAAPAVSAVDAALWDLEAKLLGLPLATLLGRVCEAVPIYGSGGFTTYSDGQMRNQLQGWVQRDGCRAVKIKVGTHPEQDPHRVDAARRAIGDGIELFVDAKGALTVKQAIAFARLCAAQGVTWFEEPVSSDDLPGLCAVRGHVPAPMEVAAGEYAFTLDDVRTMLAAGVADMMQADASRCAGITGCLRAAVLCEAFHAPLSGHCAPALHLHAAFAAPGLRRLEWFHVHARIERMLFDGAIRPDLSRPGLGLQFKRADAAAYRI